MKVLFISQYFFPENFRGNDIAFELAKEHDGHVVCATPNYPKGKFYSGYNWFKRSSEVLNGVKVTRLPIIPRGGNALTLFLNYYSFMIVSWLYILFHAIGRKYDCVIVQQLSPVMMSMPAVLYKKLRKVPLYTWVLDLWPESLTAGAGITNPLVLKYFGTFAAKQYKWSDKILISSNSFYESILRFGDYKEKIVYFPQWAEDVFTNETSDIVIPKLPEGFKIMFAGNVGETQDFNNILAAAKACSHRKDINWIIVGDGRKMQFVKEYVATNSLEDVVHIYGRFPVDAMPSFFAQADMMLVTLKDSHISKLTAPAKIQAYMCAEKPILGMIDGEGADLIKKSECGYVVPSGDYKGLAELVQQCAAISKLELQRLGLNGKEFYNQYFKKSVCLSNLKDIISSK